jgi:3-hydroxyisobutyrate dehydrogenase
VTSVARDYDIPVFLSSATEQVFALGVSSGQGLEDDSGVHRVYLPSKPELVFSQTTSATATSLSDPKTQLVISMLKGIHLFAAAEAMVLGKKVGLDVKSLYEIIQTAAGSSRMFVEQVPLMIEGKSSGGGKGLNEISVDLKAVVEEAGKIKYPLHLTAVVLQMVELAAARLALKSGAELVKLWSTEGL